RKISAQMGYNNYPF
ncbi:hypothetical protein, partial [Cronobacter sakazakii]